MEVEYRDQKRERPVDHLHCTAAGTAILAPQTGGRDSGTLRSRKRPATAPNAIPGVDVLFEEFEKIRERQYAVADEEQMQGIRAVGAPIHGPDGEVAGAIAVSGPTRRLEGGTFREELPSAVTRAANICERTCKPATSTIPRCSAILE